MMLPYRTIRSQPAVEPPPDEPLPMNLTRDIHALVFNVALCCRWTSDKRDLVVVIRRRPVDALGRAGCRVEIIAEGPMPAGGLRQIRKARGVTLWPDIAESDTGRWGDSSSRITSRTLGLEPSLLAGWKVTLDARWTC